MANNYAAPMVQTPVIGVASVTTALTTRTNITGTTGLVQLTVLNATQPTKVDAIDVQGTATGAACLVWIWLYNGTTSYLWNEIVMNGATGSTTVAGDNKTLPLYNFIVPAGWQLYASATVTQNMNVYARGGQF
jgi:hypothetical protein